MAVVVGCSDFGRALVEALGLGGRKVRSITLHVPHDDAVSVDVNLLVVDKEADEVAELVKRYQLVEKAAIDG